MDDKLEWIKSSFSSANGQCVETARMPNDGMAVRDSKNRQGSMLRFSKDEWDAFLAGVKAGEFD